MAVKRIIFLLALICTSPVYAQQEKGFIRRTLDWSYRIIQGDSLHPKKRYYFVIPMFAYKPETRILGGISITHLFRTREGDSITRPSTVRLNMSYSQNHQFSIRPHVDIFSARNRFNLRAMYTFTDFVEYYWGIGIHAPREAREMYHFRMSRINIKGAWQFTRGIYAGVQYNMEQMFSMRYDEGGASRLLNSGETGSKGSLASGAGFTIYADNRNNIYFPTRGHFIELSSCVYKPFTGSEYSFTNISLDARRYFPVWGRNVFAAEVISSLNSGDVPFRLMGTVGSESYMRGYYNGRFRDHNMMAFQGELRQNIWGPLGIVIFGGAGTVSRTVTGLTTNLKASYGAGVRVMAIPRERLNIRMDYGRGVDGNSAVYVTMGEAF
jgi:outer membrane protein assembly factor BamA